MPQFLPIGLSGGLTGAQAAGLWAYATTQTANPAIATTGLRATFMGLQGKGTPESAKLLKQYGISEGMDFQTKINTLSSAYQSGRFDLASAEQLAGREGASILLSLLQNPQAMNQMMANVVSADRGDVDLTGSMINQLMGSDETARREENIRLLKVTIANQKARDPEAMKYQETQLRNELILRKTGADEWGIAMQKGLTGFIYGAGYGDYLDTIQQYGPTVENSLKQKGVLPEGYSSGPTVINNYNNNVVYNRAETPASPRVSPKDIN
jgi:hypothetical protein